MEAPMNLKAYEKLVHVNYGPNEKPNGRQLAADFAEYVGPAARVHGLALHGPGVAAGLEVNATADATGLQVAPGVAVAPNGDVIVLPTSGSGLLGDAPPLTEALAPVVIPAASLTPFAGTKIVVIIQLQETVRQVPPPPGGTNDFPNGKLEQTPWVRVFAAANYVSAPDQVVLALADVANDGKVSGVVSAVAGVTPGRQRLGMAVSELRVERPAPDSASDAVAGFIASLAGAEGLQIRADMTALTGRLSTEGPVNGRDIAKDGTLLDSLAKRVQLLEERLQAMQASLVPVGTIALSGSPNPPTGWLPCDGAVAQISDYTELAQVLGNRYGGDGVHTFALPRLVGRFALGAGEGHQLGGSGGSETHALTNAELPAHTHAGTTQSATRVDFLRAVEQVGDDIAYNHVVGYAGGGYKDHQPSDVPGGAHQHNFTTSQSPGCEGKAFSVMPPFLVMAYVIKAR
jgi:microcystin-dependent protein